MADPGACSVVLLILRSFSYIRILMYVSARYGGVVSIARLCGLYLWLDHHFGKPITKSGKYPCYWFPTCLLHYAVIIV